MPNGNYSIIYNDKNYGFIKWKKDAYGKKFIN